MKRSLIKDQAFFVPAISVKQTDDCRAQNRLKWITLSFHFGSLDLLEPESQV